jgi:hypothetical protein
VEGWHGWRKCWCGYPLGRAHRGEYLRNNLFYFLNRTHACLFFIVKACAQGAGKSALHPDAVARGIAGQLSRYFARPGRTRTIKPEQNAWAMLAIIAAKPSSAIKMRP